MRHNRPKYNHVQQQEKQVPFTVSVIGDAKDLAVWKTERLRIEEQYKEEAAIRLQDRRRNAVEALIGERILELTGADKAEINYLKYSRNKVTTDEDVLKVDKDSFEEPKLSILQRISKAAAKLWHDAFDSLV